MYGQLHRKRVVEHLTNPDTFATSLLLILLDTFGAAALNWEEETIRLELDGITGGETVPEVNIHKLNAAKNIVASDGIYSDPVTFLITCEVMSNEDFDPELETLDVTPENIAWSLLEIYLLDDSMSEHDLSEIAAIVTTNLEFFNVNQVPKSIQLTLGDYVPEVIEDADRLSDLNSDQTFFSGYLSVQHANAEAVDSHVRRTLSALIEQISKLPLKNVDKESWGAMQKKLNKIVAGLPQSSDS